MVCFDVFDTAVLRKFFHPHDVFSLAGRLYRAGHGPLGLDFRQARVWAESQARRLAWEERGEVEVGLEDIYACLGSHAGLGREVLDRLLRLEIQAETLAATPNQAMLDLYRACLAQGKIVAFISDMYLPAEVVGAILARCGYGGWSGLFVSSGRKASKAEGGLYEVARSELGCSFPDMLHIGDNPESDGRRARERGMAVHLVLAPREAALRDKKLLGLDADGASGRARGVAASAVRGVLANGLGPRCAQRPRTEREAWWTLGFRSFGPLFHAFTAWLYARMQRDEVTSAFFLSRDGHLYKRLFDRYLELRQDASITTRYLYASRRALNIAALAGGSLAGDEALGQGDLDFLVSGASRLRVGEFLGRAGLAPGDFDLEIVRAGFSGPDQKVATGEEYGALRALFGRLAQPLRAVARAERGPLAAYLDHSGFLAAPDPAVVDIGWHGTLQESLQRITRSLRGEARVRGYYLGTFEGAGRRRWLPMRTFLCAEGLPDHRFRVLTQGVEVLETAHMAPHGSVLGFEHASSGPPRPVFDRTSEQPDLFARVAWLHEGVLAFFETFAPLARDGGLTVGPDLALAPLRRLLERPEGWEAACLGDVDHAEGFGEVLRTRKIARPPGLLGVLAGPRAWRRARRECFWKAGFDRRFLLARLLRG